MSHGVHRAELHDKTQQLLQGPLKHVKAAALAAVLLPLASVAASPAAAQNLCPSGGLCGFVFDDTNNNGSQDAAETGVEGAKVYVSDGTDTIALETGPDGQYFLFVPDGTYTISVLIPPGSQPSPANAPAATETFDSDGVLNGPYSVATVNHTGDAVDFGFFTAQVAQPGTGTPGYWKNHPEAWPVNNITVGGIVYSRDAAIAWLGKVGKDKTTTMFSSLVSAMLNVMIHNEDSCVSGTIAAANAWMAVHPVGSNVAASSAAWAQGEPLHVLMDNYNNGRLCAPHRQ